MLVYEFDCVDPSSVERHTIERMFKLDQRPDCLDFGGLGCFRREISSSAKMAIDWATWGAT